MYMYNDINYVYVHVHYNVHVLSTEAKVQAYSIITTLYN